MKCSLGISDFLEEISSLSHSTVSSISLHCSLGKAFLSLLAILWNRMLNGTDVEAEIPVLWPPDAKSWLIWKDPDDGKDWRWDEKGTTEDKMVGWHHWLSEHEFEQIPGVGDGQGGLVCCSPWGCKVRARLSDWTELILWNTTFKWVYLLLCLLFLFFSQLFVKLSQTTSLPFCISFSWGWSWSLSHI